MQRVCGMTQLDVQCAACSLRLWERLAVQACAQRSNGFHKHYCTAMALLTELVPSSFLLSLLVFYRR